MLKRSFRSCYTQLYVDLARLPVSEKVLKNQRAVGSLQFGTNLNFRSGTMQAHQLIRENCAKRIFVAVAQYVCHSAAAVLTRRKARLNHLGIREVSPASQLRAAALLSNRKSVPFYCLVLQKKNEASI